MSIFDSLAFLSAIIGLVYLIISLLKGKLSIQIGYQNTKLRGEDTYLTPYLFLVNATETQIVKVVGIGIGFIHWSFYLGIGKNVPKNLRGYNNHNKPLE